MDGARTISEVLFLVLFSYWMSSWKCSYLISVYNGILTCLVRKELRVTTVVRPNLYVRGLSLRCGFSMVRGRYPFVGVRENCTFL